MRVSFYRKTTARRPWQRRRALARRLAVSPFTGDAAYRSKSSLRQRGDDTEADVE